MDISLSKPIKIAVLALFLFMASPIAFQFPAKAAMAESLIKAERFSAVYYLGNDSKRYVFPNESVFFSWYPDFRGVVTVSEQELASYPIGGNAFVRPGTKLVKIISDPSVYAVEPGGKLREISSEAQAQALYGSDWSERVIDVPDSLFADYQIGQPLSGGEVPAGSIVKEQNGDQIYYFDGVYFRHINDMATFRMNRFQEENLTIFPIPQANIGNTLSGKDQALLNQIQRRPTGNIANNGSGGGSNSQSSGSGNNGNNQGSGGSVKPDNTNQGSGTNNSGGSQGGDNDTGNSASQYQSGQMIHSQNFAIPASAENGDVVGEVNRFWTDLDNINPAYSLSGGNGAFEVDASGLIRIKDNSKLGGSSQSIRIRATSGGKTEEADMNIRILPENATIYIDPSAVSSGNGSRQSPLKSWKGITIASDKNYLQKRGTSETLSTRINIGEQNNVLIGAYGSSAEKPKVTIQNLKGGTNAAVSLTGSNNTVRDLDIDAKLSTTGIYSGGGDNNRLENVRVRNSEWGLRTMNAATGFKLLDSEISYTGDDGHYSQNHDDMEIAYNYIHHINQHWNENSYWYKGKSEKDAPGDGIQLNGTIRNFNVHHNIIDRSDTDNKFCVIISPIQNNEYSNGRLEYNHCTLKKGGNESGFYIFHGVFGAKVRYNTFVDGRGIWSHSKDLIISNNLFIRSTMFAQYNTPALVFDNDFRN